MALFLFLFFRLGFVPALLLNANSVFASRHFFSPPFLTISFPTDIIFFKAVLFVSSEL